MASLVVKLITWNNVSATLVKNSPLLFDHWFTWLQISDCTVRPFPNWILWPIQSTHYSYMDCTMRRYWQRMEWQRWTELCLIIRGAQMTSSPFKSSCTKLITISSIPSFQNVMHPHHPNGFSTNHQSCQLQINEHWPVYTFLPSLIPCWNRSFYSEHF